MDFLRDPFDPNPLVRICAQFFSLDGAAGTSRDSIIVRRTDQNFLPGLACYCLRTGEWSGFYGIWSR